MNAIERPLMAILTKRYAQVLLVLDDVMSIAWA
jgi:hypothetical protein